MNLKSTSLGRQWDVASTSNGARITPHQSRANEGRVIAQGFHACRYFYFQHLQIKAARFGTWPLKEYAIIVMRQNRLPARSFAFLNPTSHCGRQS
jgi:hypothetical protein